MSVDQDVEFPASKRRKVANGSQTNRQTGSRLFASFRTIGLVSPTPVPFCSASLGTTTFQITTSIGKSLQTYDLRRGLSLVFLSRPQCPETLTATCAYRDRVFAAWGGGKPNGSRGIWVVKRGRIVAELDMRNTVFQEIQSLSISSTWIIGCGTKAIEVWRANTYEHYTSISTTNSQQGRGFSNVMCTLPTYLNKIFVGGADGFVHIYNVRTGKLVYSVPPAVVGAGSVTAMQAAPAVGLLAVAHNDGSIHIVNVDEGEPVISFRQSSPAYPVSSISFRTDGIGAGDDGRHDGIMATASNESGDVTFWDLNNGGKIVAVLRGAHQIQSLNKAQGITKIEFLPGQAVLVSSGLDNSIKSWIFDQTPFSPTPRLLHSRSGHSAPISQLRFLPAASDGSEAAGKWLLSAGQDRSLWGLSLRKDTQSSELSQGNVQHRSKKLGDMANGTSILQDLKVPTITRFACSLNRDGGMGGIGGPVWTNPKASNAEEANMTGWESVITAHEGDKFARTWFWGRKRAGRWAFETGDHNPVSSVAITTCGTFALVGSSGGSLDMFNLQSGIHRQKFPPKLTSGQAKKLRMEPDQMNGLTQERRGHTDAVTGIVVDNLNRTMVSISLDGTAIFWDFATGNVLSRLHFRSGAPNAVRYNSVSGLLSIACDDSCIRIIDIETRKIVRELWGCTGQIYDHCFSSDGRWIVATSMDSIIRIFDLATGHLIDAFKTATCTNVTFSSTGEYLATAHAGGIGVNIWNNKSLYMHIPTRQIDEDRGIVDLTELVEFEASHQVMNANETEENELDVELVSATTSLDHLNEKLLTLSLLPSSRWQTLLNLDAIRERNKPIQAPEKPKAAPFFLGTTNGLISDKQDGEEVKVIMESEKTRISRLTSTNPMSTQLSILLEEFSTHGESNPEQFVNYMAGLSPSAADLDIRSLTLSEMTPFVKALTARLQECRDYELVNTWMSVFLRLHTEFVTGVDEVKEAVLVFKSVMDEEEKRLSHLVGWSRGVLDYLRSAR